MKEWQISLKNAVSDPVQLFELLGLTYAPESNLATKQFPLRVPHEFIARMEKGNVQDPLLLQVLPQAQEILEKPGFVSDPLNEKKYNPVPGLLHKYQGRVLLTLQGACAVNCRYCFRRNFPYEDNMPGTAQWGQILEYIANDESIEEVIFSGGDPLIMKDQQLGSFVKNLDEIKHLSILRIHTRLPIMIPSRINDEFFTWMNASRLQKIMAIHCNHPKEIDESVIEALARLRENNVILLNQSVLLKNVNDKADILTELSKALFKAHVLPYYLHILDPVAGSEHFNVDVSSAKKIINEMRSGLPGYLVPKLVQEIPGEKSKIGL